MQGSTPEAFSRHFQEPQPAEDLRSYKSRLDVYQWSREASNGAATFRPTTISGEGGISLKPHTLWKQREIHHHYISRLKGNRDRERARRGWPWQVEVDVRRLSKMYAKYI